jgi:hypothetical protein
MRVLAMAYFIMRAMFVWLVLKLFSPAALFWLLPLVGARKLFSLLA